MRRPTLVLLLLACSLPVRAGAQRADSALARSLASVRAIDDHTHASRALAPGDTLDPDADAAPCPPDGAGAPPARLVGAHPLMLRGWRVMYGYPYDDASPAHLAELPALRRRAWAAHAGEGGFPAWMLDQLGTETAMANRVAMGNGMPSSRYRWVPFVDALVFPLDTRALRTNPDRAWFFEKQAEVLSRYRSALDAHALPRTLDGYVREVVGPTLERFGRDGAVALKFELAYLRSLDVQPASHDDAARVYARYAGGGAPAGAEYRVVQDYLIREIALHAGRMRLPVQFHTGGGCGGYFDLAGSAPSRLSALVDDPAMRATQFVILHGGGSYHGETAFMTTKANVWADFSALPFTSSPRTIAEVVRPWLELAPGKVLFGTDFSATDPGTDGADVAYLTTVTAREGLVRALAQLVDDGELSLAQAEAMGRMVLRGNAIALYRLPEH